MHKHGQPASKPAAKAPKVKTPKKASKSFLDVVKAASRPIPGTSYRPPAGLDEKATVRFIEDAESLDRGLPRYPWGDAFKAKVKAAIEGQRNLTDCQTVINRMVVGELGAGIHGRGPFA